ncbi:alpha/beta fold hydrolase [Jatrophihabitans cynanchi]|uniref:Alpha/beta fold hydrolase n=1 Tax=Jatrophihabitans cynanchi TaxID=2944128 RepID=A0ABY7JUX3_9ACTN|nr:alpha/beta fold hydrolase [Jatrophihabitans sp. SB3-54]WAX56352.1 alpha/beta fold hydrolase [Jatrophihabitans sp. SB3-54]
MTGELTRDGTLRELATGNGVLRYHEAGGGPPLVLLHGSGPGVSGWQNYRGVLAALAEHHRCLVLEFPGFGVSDPAKGHPMMTAAAAVLQLLDGLGLQSADVIGNSMGGIVALNVAAAHPRRVGKLVTIGGVGLTLFSASPAEGINLLMEFAANPTRERLVEWLHSMVYDRALVTEELIEERWALATAADSLATARAMYSRETFLARQAAMADSDQPPYWAMLHKVSAPTLLTWGRDDRVSPLDSVLVPMRTMPNAEVHVFPRCGHWTMLEQRDAFVATVLAFLARKA